MKTMKLPPVVGIMAMLLATAEVFAQEPAAIPKPESTGDFLKRMKPVLDKEAAVEKINAEIPKITVQIKFLETPLSAALGVMNESIRAHNAQPGALRVPLIQILPRYLRGTPEYEKLRRDHPGGPDPAVDDKMPMTLDFGNIKLDEAITYVSRLSVTTIDIEPDGIWLSPDIPDEPLMEKRDYLIPPSICSTREEVEKWINKGLTAYNVKDASWDFDKKSHLLALQQSEIYIREFEKWYARELLRHGFLAAEGK
jgi:hypothetical protein